MNPHQLIEIKSLEARYGIGYAGIAKRRKFLGIVPTKIKTKYFVTPIDLVRLDHLHNFLTANPFASMSEYSESAELMVTVPTTVTKQVEETNLTTDTESTNLTTQPKPVSPPKPTPPPPPSPHPLDRHYLLKEIAQEGAWLTTTELRHYLGIIPHGNEFRWRQWLFTCIARQGNERLWQVTTATSKLEQRYSVDNNSDRLLD